ncbi:MAG: hypothetical protein JSW09_00855 [Pseudomonadota bacterium]|nr:MAG: hypothetical protein JSW09_00855 [Pseudomonadota bacterium]
MDELKCSFSAPLITGGYGCSRAKAVTRRGGPDIACTSHEAQVQCTQLYGLLKSAALPAFGVEDDLLTMPHSVMQRIQYGGLRGLQRLLHGNDADVGDVHALVVDAVARYASLEAVPYGEIVPDITGCQPRGGRRR